MTSKLSPLAIVSKDKAYGTSLQGYVKTTFAVLVALMGEPHCINGDKTTAEWGWKLENGQSLTVYDWKRGATPEGLYNWHIGGHSQAALVAFKRFTGLSTTSF